MFESTAWAIDGARTRARLARIATYNSTSGAEGVARAGDLKVRPLSVPGAGIVIGGGAALVLNRYPDGEGETYAVLNKGDHTISAGSMPPATGSPQHYLVVVTVGDGEFSQVGHPWMTSSDPTGDPTVFNYVRPTIIPCAPGATRLTTQQYPALVLARLEVPANTSTITAPMIKDLRQMAQVRRVTEMANIGISFEQEIGKSKAGANLALSVRHRFPDVSVAQLQIPTWATTAKVLGFVEGLRRPNGTNGAAGLRISIGGTSGAALASTPESNVNEPSLSQFTRAGYTVGGTLDIPESLRGTTQNFFMEANITQAGYRGFLATDIYSGIVLQVIFEETAI